jgi:integrase/recombinase XerD
VNWDKLIKEFQAFLLLEKGLSRHSIEAYERDVIKLAQFDLSLASPKGPLHIEQNDIELFIREIFDLGLDAKSQARIISGIKSFYKYLLLEDLLDKNPAQLIEGPRIKRKLPDILSYEEIELIINSLDMSLPFSHRNKAILETLYACGLRVSELVNLNFSGFYPELGYIRVIGKNNKERIVPIGDEALKQIDLYITSERKEIPVKKEFSDVIFLNRRGKNLSRVMIFHIVKNAVSNAGIDKIISPHTFRHSFASHLVEGGADLRAVQEMLGHESITTTEIYTHVNNDYLRETILMYHPGNKKKQNHSPTLPSSIPSE